MRDEDKWVIEGPNDKQTCDECLSSTDVIQSEDPVAKYVGDESLLLHFCDDCYQNRLDAVISLRKGEHD